MGPVPEYVLAPKALTAAAKAVPQTSAVKLASWNQKPLDEDTQELFSDSPQVELIDFQPRKSGFHSQYETMYQTYYFSKIDTFDSQT